MTKSARSIGCRLSVVGCRLGGGDRQPTTSSHDFTRPDESETLRLQLRHFCRQHAQRHIVRMADTDGKALRARGRRELRELSANRGLTLHVIEKYLSCGGLHVHLAGHLRGDGTSCGP